MTHYAKRDIEHQAHYTAHVDAMTKEGLHSKSDIAAELAHRDAQIDKLEKALAWQPIETAPKDSEWVMVTRGGDSVPDITFYHVGRWVDQHCEPTHWKHLPTPPEEKTE